MRNEQSENDKFVRLCGSVAKADRVQQIWNKPEKFIKIARNRLS